MGDGLNGFRGAPAQGVNVHNIAPAHVGEQAADGGLLGRDGDINIAALDQVHVVRVVDQGQYLAGTQPLGQQRGHDVGFVVVGDGAEHIDVLDVLFQQDVLVGGVAFQHHGFA